ncbi:uncharacterized protein LOC110096809 isoform X1 [Dendrobium catenatum]|uniref:uncharacterized protein LOC110096809 isoform X1 n=2 Tax=Dendrobium catenatum TaxID=906689 RepID=UPI00109EF37A|nr:uncharacterized protein LOC110096809 isoform X1 [Dendrobium catenatum]XP_028557142.1 uncharacterized protein LOC110096809 isoform X1 [Dendrobium catenatum]XP_028557143.1 uncharacterized protein LOC110096809 isoform X1 [Dendrobium catenatum]
MIRATEEAMEEDLQNFHWLLEGLCADELRGQGEGRLQSVNLSFAKMKSGHLIEVSNVIFKELLRQFENLNFFLRCPLDGVSGLNSKVQCTIEGFIVLLRCCLKILQFLEFDMSFLWEKCGYLLKIIGKFCPENLVLSSHGCSVVSARDPFSQCCSSLGGISEEADPLLSLFPLIFEVFIVEFSENLRLRKHLISVNVLTANSGKLCACRYTQARTCIFLELVFGHFIQLIRNDLDYSRFLHSLSGSSDIDRMIPDISLDASLKLISSPFMLSAPFILQAQLILLASRCVSTHLPIEGRKSDTSAISCYIDPFEISVKLYLSYLSTLQLDAVILGANGRSNHGVKALFPSGSSILKMTWGKFTHQANDLVDFSHLYSEGVLSGTKSDVIAFSAAYIRGNHPLIDQLCKDATCLVVDYMIESIIPMKVWKQRHHQNRERIQQEVYCLAAAMKLMNSSLLHTIWLLRQTECHNQMKTLSDNLTCRVYECLSQSASIIRVSGCGADQEVQKFLCDMLGAYGGLHQEIKFMLAHISSLLVFSFKRKLDFLWKGCISMMLTLMNLILFEERNLGLSKIFKLLQSPSMDYEGLTYRSTSVIIARNLEKTRMLYLKNEIRYVHFKENSTDSSKRSEEDQQSRTCTVDGMDHSETQGKTSNGERFIECDPSYHRNPSEWEDLVDFIECSPGKDYSSWLKNRNKFNKWKQEKSAIFKSQKKKKRTYIKKFYNLRSRVDASESNEVKSQDQRSRKSCGRRHQGQRGA